MERINGYFAFQSKKLLDVSTIIACLRRCKILIVTRREFWDNRKKHLDMVYKNEKVVGQRKNRACKLIPINKVDMFVEIPEDYRCDAYEISPSGDMFWADKRNVEKVKKAIESKDQIAARLYSADDIKDFLKSL